MDNNIETEKQKTPSRIIITFDEPNSVLLDVQYVNATPLQVYAAGWVLQKSAEDAINNMNRQQEERKQLEKIAVPPGYGGMMPK